MKISIVCVGKVKEKFFRGAIDEYVKRLGRYCKLEIIEVTDEKTPDNASDHEVDLIKDKEGERILKNISPDAYVIALAIEGKQLSSEELADKIDKLGIQGTSHIQLIIGGSLGLADKVLKRADMLLSFSKMTFPHQLMRVVLLEQIYRSYRIIQNEPYHK
jgi:23S rRNA (pseudouridine1915-N3)-methyltransferase